MVYLGWFLVLLGSIFIMISAIGSIKMPDFYSKLHAIGVGDSCGAPLCLLGFCFINGLGMISLKIILLFILIVLLSPTSTHALIRSGVVRKSNFIGKDKVKIFRK